MEMLCGSPKKQIWWRKKGCQILLAWPAKASKFGVRQILFCKKQDLAVVLRDGSRQKKNYLADLRQSPNV